MSKTKIEWCDETINPVVGCSKISDGCKNCYAEKMAWRLKCMGIPKYQDVVDQNGWTGKIGLDLSVLDNLNSTQKPKKIFISSMGDLFHENVPAITIKYIMDMVISCPQHTFLFLTKRVDKMEVAFRGASPRMIGLDYEYLLPLHNVLLGVTVESPDYLCRIDELLKIKAAVRFVSFEPMLEPVDLSACTYWDDPSAGIHWIIIGCETGPKRRETKLKWIEDTVKQCSDFNIPVFVKQAEIDGKIVKLPKINGKTWNQFPREFK